MKVITECVPVQLFSTKPANEVFWVRAFKPFAFVKAFFFFVQENCVTELTADFSNQAVAFMTKMIQSEFVNDVDAQMTFLQQKFQVFYLQNSPLDGTTFSFVGFGLGASFFFLTKRTKGSSSDS